MEFGRVDNVAGINFVLPRLRTSANLLANGKSCKVRIGLPIWSNASFVGTIYPSGTKAKDYLLQYARVFDTIELNATHYAAPTKERILKWCEAVSEDFRFCPKVPQSISHSKSPKIDEWLSFLDIVQSFGEKRGPLFLQFPEYADLSWRRTVFELAKNTPEHIPVLFEFRHPDWFLEKSVWPKLADYLGSRGHGFVMTDAAGRRDALHMTLASPVTMIRFLGNALHDSDFSRIKKWAETVDSLRSHGATEVYFFIHQQTEVDGWPLVLHLRACLGLADADS